MEDQRKELLCLARIFHFLENSKINFKCPVTLLDISYTFWSSQNDGIPAIVVTSTNETEDLPNSNQTTVTTYLSTIPVKADVHRTVFDVFPLGGETGQEGARWVAKRLHLSSIKNFLIHEQFVLLEPGLEFLT